MQQPQIDLSKSTGIVCASCNGLFFEQSMILRKFSKLYTMTPTDQVVPVMFFRCVDCGEPMKEFFPEGMTDVEQRLGLTKISSGNIIL